MVLYLLFLLTHLNVLCESVGRFNSVLEALTRQLYNLPFCTQIHDRSIILVRGLDQDDYFNEKKEYLDPNNFFNIVIKLGKCVKLQKI